MATRDDVSSSSSEVKKDIDEHVHIGTLLKEAPRKGLVQLKNSFRSLSASPKRLASTGSERDKNDPTRFLGDGMQYKAKLIGVLEVSDARGDRMCQEALGDLKMAIRAAGEHKQRIIISIGINGVRLLDEKNGDCLYHHPVHKISFIALDPTDPRAFGYIFGCPDSGHRFFGIKTEKGAQVVSNAMRELFDVFLDLRKTQDFETELTANMSSHHNSGVSPSNEYTTLNRRTIREEPCSVRPTPPTQKPFVDLLDLEVELNSLKSHPEDKSSRSSRHVEDPFGDSFSLPPPTNSYKVKLPPPPSSKTEANASAAALPLATEEHWNASAAALPQPTEEHWFDKETRCVFESEPFSQDSTKSQKSLAQRSDNLFDVFMELDPLGTGRVKPYVDKKDFFSDLKKPPKQVLNDLVHDYDNDSAARERNSSFSYDTMDPFNKIDPFETEPPVVNFEDAFDTPFSDFSTFDRPVKQPQPQLFGANMGPLQVTLPPENRTPLGSPSLSKHRKMRSSSTSGKLRSRSQHASDDSRNSPVMEGVYLRNRNLDTPSPTSAPEPPPRPAITCYSIKPPPLPPKKQSPSIMPRPGSRHSDYDFIQNYESIPSMPSEAPPLPVPVRKPKLSAEYDASYVPQRPKKSSISSMTSSIETDYYLTPNNFTPTNLSNKTSLDMTLSQLTKTGFSELATALNMSPSALSKLTIGELTEYMASLSKEDQRSTCDAIKEDQVRRKSNAFTEEESTFEADFEGKFSNEPSLYDKYAVFRELVEEKPYETKERPYTERREVVEKTMRRVQERGEEDRYAALRGICIEPGSDTEEAKRDGYKTLDDETSYMQLNNVRTNEQDQEDKDEDSYMKFEAFNGDDQNIVSDKEEDSVAEELQVKEEDEEGRDLLDMSRPQSYSESTESPTTIFKEPQCIIESTIVEEEDIENVSPLENDKAKRGFDEKDSGPSWAAFEEISPATLQTSSIIRSTTQSSPPSHPAPSPPAPNPSPWSATDDVSSPGNEAVRVKTNKPKKNKWIDADKDLDRRREREHSRHRDRERGRAWEWEENGHSWSDDEENDEDDDSYVPQYSRERKYYDNKRDRRRKPSPWTKSSRDPSPWQETEPELPDWETSSRTKSKVRGSSTSISVDEERKEIRKKGVSPWSIDTSWDDKERYQRTRKQSEERRRRHRDEVEHSRRERSWKSNRYHESPWDEEYVESDEMSPRPRHWKPSSKKYQEPYDSEEEIYVKKQYSSRGAPYVESEDKIDRYNKKYYKGLDEDRIARRRRYSQDELEDEGGYRRKPVPVYNEDMSEEDKPFRRKPYSHDEMSGSDIEQHYSRRSQTLHFNKPRNTKQRRPSKSSPSPFEDDFIPSSSGSHFEFPDVKLKKSSLGQLSPAPGPDVKPNRSCDPKCCLRSPDVTLRQSSPLNTPPVKRVSPFEDDFTPADIRRTSGRSGTSSYSETESVFMSQESKPFPQESQMKKSESINIFKQEDDPFEDDEFFKNGTGSKDLGEDETLHKWKRAFDSFNFEENGGDTK
uniref:Protein disabled n=1 Tax=Cacopsylla melanoneura TaxID=428564 RepID=A0A8D9BYF7_9HEMI